MLNSGELNAAHYTHAINMCIAKNTSIFIVKVTSFDCGCNKQQLLLPCIWSKGYLI